jgi:Mrp family chromosome partitioning ATPase
MRAKEDLFDPMDSVLEGFTPEVSGWRQKWRSMRDGTTPPSINEHSLVPSQAPRDTAHDEMLQLVQRVFLAPGTIAPRRVMFCGIDKNNSSEVCASAGRVLAEQTGSTVCLVDANVRNSPLSKLFDLDEKKSTFGRLAPWREQCLYVSKNLFVAGTGVLGGSHGGLAPSSEMRDRIVALSSSFEYLLFDAPGASTSADTALLGQVAGSVVLVLEAKSTRRVEAKKVKERLEMANIRILGAVLHNHTR